MRTTCFSCWLLVLAVLVFEKKVLRAQAVEFDLANGIHLIVNSIPEAPDVAVEMSYEVGFVDEPKSLVQAAHLLEHLICYSPGAGFESKGAFGWLNQVGMANAETLADWTHYDYVVPKDDVEKVFEIEASRLSLAAFDRRLLLQEAQRVYGETDAVESNPQTGMVKHAFMAIAHAWRHAAPMARVRGGLEDFAEEDLLDFYVNNYQPNRLTVAVTGGIQPAKARQLAEKYLSRFQNSTDSGDSPIDWAHVPAVQQVAWDARPTAVCVAWEPPPNGVQRGGLSLLATLAYGRLTGDAELKKSCAMVFCSNSSWPVGDLPLFVYASVKDSAQLDAVQESLADRFSRYLLQVAREADDTIPQMLFQYEHLQQKSTWATIERTSQTLLSATRSPRQAIRLVLLQDALNRIVMRRLLGSQPSATIERLKSLTEEQWVEIAESALQPRQRHVVRIVPNDHPS